MLLKYYTPFEKILQIPIWILTFRSGVLKSLPCLLDTMIDRRANPTSQVDWCAMNLVPRVGKKRDPGNKVAR